MVQAGDWAMSKRRNKQGIFESFAGVIAEWTGKPIVFTTAAALIVVWAISGPIFDYSETWQLIVNTATTIITFLMVFVLQNSQNRDGRALQAKLDELILSSHAKNSFVGIENLDDRELRRLIRRLEEQADTLKEKADGKLGDADDALPE
ncbi:low affinity iron permease family protein [Rhizobium cremeum]|uniref:low affinity iron permease family protein n=1 Tax=Rhizobium cremeum TaxID=2813827 RepID=UPI000DD4F81F